MVLYFHLLNRPLSAAWVSANGRSRLTPFLASFHTSPAAKNAGSSDGNNSNKRYNNFNNNNNYNKPNASKPAPKKNTKLLKMKMSQNIEIDKLGTVRLGDRNILNRSQINKVNAKPLSERASDGLAAADKIAKMANPQNPASELHTLLTPIRQLEESKKSKEPKVDTPQTSEKEEEAPKQAKKETSYDYRRDASLKYAFFFINYLSN
jgi:hypothetical protein